nr:glycoside hydrolase family 31 protein [Bacteroidota bacterium]
MYIDKKSDKYSIKHYPQTITSYKRAGNFIYFFSADTQMEIKVVSDTIMRFRYALDEGFDRDFSYALAPDLKETLTHLEINDTGLTYEIYTGKIICQVNKENFKINIYDAHRNIILEDETGFHWQHYIWKGGKIVFCSKKIQEGESFYGLGDKPTEFNIRNKRFENYGADTYGYKKDTDPLYKNIPFYMGSHHNGGYGIFFDNTFRTLFDFGAETSDVASFWARGGEMNYYFIYGPQLLNVVEQYAYLTGKPELPPLWALGYHQCRWSYFPESKVLSIAHEFRKRNIPCDALYLDIDYMEGFRCFTFSKEHFPNHTKMIKTLADNGFKTVVIIDPGIKVDKEYNVYSDGIKNDVYCKRSDGSLMQGDVWPGQCVFPDYTNPKAREWWSKQFDVLVDAGVRGVWNDMNEPAVFEMNTFPEDVRHDFDGDPCSHRKAHNIYGHLMAKATFDGIRKLLMPNRPFVITRSCYSGVQKYSSVWTGDNTATWEHLWIANMQCQRLSISGISFAGSDIGGFVGEPDGELYTRWLQMAVFHPFCRTHSASNENNFDQEPWSFGHKYEFINKRYITLRYRLLPYLYSTFWQNSNEGTPMLRPLAFMDEHNKDTAHFSHQFFLGDHLMVCPVAEQGATTQPVYLPHGNWYNYWTDEMHHGHRTIIAHAPIDIIPVMVRAGAVIPKHPPMQYVGEKKIDEILLHVYAGTALTRSVWYTDAGDGYGYMLGQYRISTFDVSGDKKSLTITQQIDGLYHAPHHRFKVVLHGTGETAKEYIVDGKSHRPAARNFAAGTLKFSCPLSFNSIEIIF